MLALISSTKVSRSRFLKGRKFHWSLGKFIFLLHHWNLRSLINLQQNTIDVSKLRSWCISTCFTYFLNTKTLFISHAVKSVGWEFSRKNFRLYLFHVQTIIEEPALWTCILLSSSCWHSSYICFSYQHCVKLKPLLN